MPGRRSRAHVKLAWLGLCVLAIYWRGPRFRLAFEVNYFPPGFGFFLPDFFQEWASARNYLEALPIYTPHEVTVERYCGLRVDTSDPYFIQRNAHPPTSVLLGLPFAQLDFRNALPVWNILSLLLFFVSGYWIVQGLEMRFEPWNLLPAFVILLLCNPFLQQMVQGQMNLLLLFLTTLAWRLERTGRSAAAGALVGVATAIKLFPWFLLVYFLFLKKWRATVSAILTVAALNLLVLLLVGIEPFWTYLFAVVPQTSRADWHNLSLCGLWFKLFDNFKYLPPIDVHPLLSSPGLALASTLTSVAAMGLGLGLLVRRLGARGDTDGAFGIAIIGMLVVSPITWDHYLMLLMLPITILWQRLPKRTNAKQILVVLLIVLSIHPWQIAEHVLILLQNDSSTVGPTGILVGLSLPCYAVLGVLTLSCWTFWRIDS
jgi:glycosyl transferase family 87